MMKDPLYTKSSVEQDYGYSIPINDFFQCALSVDCTIIGYDEGELKVLLIKRGAEPYKDRWALPGDLMYPNEDLNKAAKRVLSHLTGLSDVFLHQVRVFGEVDRHPLGRVITVGYFSLLKIADYNPKASAWANQLDWHPLREVPYLAFDHNPILQASLSALRKMIWEEQLGFKLLPEKFTLGQIQKLYEAILEEKFDKANFRKKILATNLLMPLGENEKNVSHRPAKLYALNKQTQQTEDSANCQEINSFNEPSLDISIHEGRKI